MILTFCTWPVLFIIVTGFSLAVGHPACTNYQARLNNMDMQINNSSKRKQINYAPKIDGVCRVLLVRQKHIAIRISGLLNRDIPVYR